MNKTTVMLCPVFKNNLGIHFTTKPLSGVNSNAWYEIPVPHNQINNLEEIHPHIEKLFKAANLAVAVGRITKHQDLVVEFTPIPDGYHYVMTAKGYDLVPKDIELKAVS
ncbi:hypothetical protein [Pseudoalteromonas phage KB12-38]|nr:hypothetical protein [Pseudoalteromonas phage KB12-38]